MLRIGNTQFNAIQFASDCDFVKRTIAERRIEASYDVSSNAKVEKLVETFVAKAHEYGLADPTRVLRFAIVAMSSSPPFYESPVIDGFLRFGPETASDRFDMLLNVASHLLKREMHSSRYPEGT